MRAIVEALAKREGDIRLAVDRIRDLDEGDWNETVHVLREAAELVGCLRRLTAGRSAAEIHRAFGAPGDFGYETPVGDALSRVYRGEE